MRYKILKFGLAAAFVAAAFSAAAGSAPASNAAVTTSQITAPANHTYYTYNDSAPAQLTISGTSDGTTGDAVDINCDWGPNSTTLAGNVSVDANGSFSTSVSLALLKDKLCVVRAVPAATSPADVSPYHGSTVGVGHRHEYVNNTTVNDFYIWGQQAKGAFDYNSSTSCGVDDGYLYDSSLAQTTTTFYCDAWLSNANAATPTRSELVVDGANAYGPYTADSINVTATGRPALTYSYSVDKKTGDLTIHETDPIVKCTDPTYPATAQSCATFVSAGVTEHRTTTQDHDGLLAWVTDVFTSTDGKSHKLDLLYENDNYFGPNGNGTSIEYKFPGQSSYAIPTLGESVKLPAKPGTVLIRVHGSADADPATGRGAVVYDRPASSAEIAYLNSESTFELQQKATVPRHGSTRFRFAFAQAYTQATVDDLAKLATVTFAGCAVPKVTGKPLAKAKSALKHAGCSVGKVSQATSATVKKGAVISEKPKAGSHLAYLAKVALVESKGKK